ncbi:MAG: DUF6602 domain-containing protein [Rhizomicrobium sp.]
MSDWSLPKLLAGLHEDIEQRLARARSLVGHPVSKGDASEGVWLELLATYLPKRYNVAKAHVVDSDGNFSDQIDVVVFDRQYSPFIFTMDELKVVPAESVYAVFEARQSIDAGNVQYARNKVKSVRRLKRTSLPIPHAGGVHEGREPLPIIGGLLTLESGWSPPLGEALRTALTIDGEQDYLDIGCVATSGMFLREEVGTYSLLPEGKPATAFLLELIARLQALATVPMIDIRAYARWLDQ